MIVLLASIPFLFVCYRLLRIAHEFQHRKRIRVIYEWDVVYEEDAK